MQKLDDEDAEVVPRARHYELNDQKHGVTSSVRNSDEMNGNLSETLH